MPDGSDSSAFHAMNDCDPEIAAQRVLAHRWDGILPVRPEHIAKEVGYLAVTPVLSSRLNVSCGASRRSDRRSSADLSIDATNPANRFALSHAIGHHVLGHKTAEYEDPSNFRSDHANPQERAANLFAIRLLIPMSALHKLVIQQSCPLMHWAQVFGVSQTIMIRALSDLRACQDGFAKMGG